MLTRTIDQIKLIIELEKDVPEWERQDYLTMNRDEREMYLNYLKGEAK